MKITHIMPNDVYCLESGMRTIYLEAEEFNAVGKLYTAQEQHKVAKQHYMKYITCHKADRDISTEEFYSLYGFLPYQATDPDNPNFILGRIVEQYSQDNPLDPHEEEEKWTAAVKQVLSDIAAFRKIPIETFAAYVRMCYRHLSDATLRQVELGIDFARKMATSETHLRELLHALIAEENVNPADIDRVVVSDETEGE